MHASLAAIGRVTAVESEEPPQRSRIVGCAAIDESDDSEAENGKNFVTLAPEDIHEVIENVQHKFISFERLNATVCQTVLGVNCAHSNPTSQVASLFFTVTHHEERLEQVELHRQIAARLKDFGSFMQQVRSFLVEELRNLQHYQKNCSGVGEEPGVDCVGYTSRLGYLRTMCDSLRLCLNQAWTLCSCVQQNSVLQRILPRIRPMLDNFMERHQQLTISSILTIHKLVEAGLLVISHSDLSRYSHSDLWEISRGIEEFNTIVEHMQQQRRIKLYRTISIDYPTANCRNLFAQFEGSIDHIDLIKPLSFSKILSKLAAERSTKIVESIHHFFFASKDLVKLLKHTNLEELPFECFEKRRTSSSSSNSLAGGRSCTTSGDSSENSSPSGQGSQRKLIRNRCAKIVTRLLRNGSPVNDLLRMEQDFASGFLDIISQSTEMLKELQNPRRKRLQKEETLDTFMAPVPPPKKPSVVSLTPTPRKGVQWSDREEVSVRHHVLGRYLQLVWTEVDKQLDWVARSHARCTNKEQAKAYMGSILLLSAPCVLFLAIVIKDSAQSELFPSGILTTLQQQSAKYKSLASLSLWDQGVSLALGSSTTLQLHPTPLTGDLYSSRIYKALLAAVEPMMSALRRHVDRIQELFAESRGKEIYPM